MTDQRTILREALEKNDAESLRARMETLGTELISLHHEPTKNKSRISEITAEMKHAETRLRELEPKTKRTISDFSRMI